MTPLLQTGLLWLLQSTLLLTLGLLSLHLARKRGPAVQTALGRATLLAVALAPLLAYPLVGHIQPLWHLSLPSTVPHTVPHISSKPAPLSEAALPRLSDLPKPTSTNHGPLIAPPLTPAPLVSGGETRSVGVGLLWPLTTLFLLLWLAACLRHLTTLHRTARRLTSGPAFDLLSELTPRPPTLFAHPAVRSPFLAGVLRPAIFLPANAETEFNPAALRAILAHELAHRDRHDTLWLLLSRLLTALLWPQPLLWLLCRRLEAIGEEACDLSVLARDCPPRAYADCLLSLAERRQPSRRQRALGAGVAPFRSSLGRRVQQILSKGNHIMPTVSARLRLTIAAGALAAVIGGLFLVSSAPAQVTQPAAASREKLTLVGIWSGKSNPKAKQNDRIVFGPQGELASVEQGGSQFEYGHYELNGAALTVRMAGPIFDARHRKIGNTQTSALALTYSITDSVLTLQRKGAPTVAVRRVSDYPDGVTIGTVAAQQATLLGTAKSTSEPTPFSQTQLLAGLMPVQGPGVMVMLTDSKKQMPDKLPSGMSPPNIIHDSDINSVVNGLKAAGAEAIAVNDQRIVATSSVRCAGPTLFVNGIPLTSPFVIKAIGEPKTLVTAVNNPGGVIDNLKRFDPAMCSVQSSEVLTLPAFTGSGEPRYARPIAD